MFYFGNGKTFFTFLFVLSTFQNCIQKAPKKEKQNNPIVKDEDSVKLVELMDLSLENKKACAYDVYQESLKSLFSFFFEDILNFPKPKEMIGEFDHPFTRMSPGFSYYDFYNGKENLEELKSFKDSFIDPILASSRYAHTSPQSKRFNSYFEDVYPKICHSNCWNPLNIGKKKSHEKFREERKHFFQTFVDIRTMLHSYERIPLAELMLRVLLNTHGSDGYQKLINMKLTESYLESIEKEPTSYFLNTPLRKGNVCQKKNLFSLIETAINDVFTPDLREKIEPNDFNSNENEAAKNQKETATLLKNRIESLNTEEKVQSILKEALLKTYVAPMFWGEAEHFQPSFKVERFLVQQAIQ
jgi:hypothetical protein